MRIAKTRSRGRKPIQIRAEALEQVELVSPFPAPEGSGRMADDPSKKAKQEGAPVEGEWDEADLKRAIEAAEQSNLQGYRVEIAPDGTMKIVIKDRS